uniref:DUF305 domain-containing protein n=1 Tax=Thermosporothrix sp. COM3 TaxID=2490863 RepID=A0A455SV56_9CHLR|nr:hypothetical protein KTC_62710 [Thermosporothrix sp. COM3]
MKRFSLVLLGVVLAVLLAACGGTSQEGAPPGSSNAPFDAKFIDGMVKHHQGAIDMAKEAQQKAEHQEIKNLANSIVTDQQKEITEMQNWRKQWYPGLAQTNGLDMHMGEMKISDDTSKPFDQRFLAAMISHHQGAIDMAKEAQQKAEHQEIKNLANSIITAQQKEIDQMKQWEKSWYGQSSEGEQHH